MADDFDSDEESIVSLPAWEEDMEDEYNELMAQLRGNENGLKITIYREVFEFIFNEGNMDEFCDALHSASSLKSLDFGHSCPWLDEDETPLSTLEITPENAEALDKLFEAVQIVGNRLEGLHLRLVGKISSTILCRLLVAASQEKLRLRLEVPWYYSKEEQDDEGMKLLVDTAQNVELYDAIISFKGTNDYVDGDESQHRLHKGDPLWHLMRSEKPTPSVDFEQIDFTLVGCKHVEEILLSSVYTVTIEQCTFPTDGGKMISSAIGKSSLCMLSLFDVFDQQEFCQDLIRNIPLSSSLYSLTIGFGTDDSIERKEKFLTNLLKAVMKKNSKELETINLELPNSAQLLNEEHQLELLPFLQRNYYLKEIEIKHEPSPVFETILRLNRARRRYLIEDSAFPNSCIRVLGNVNVNGHLDSLFFHLRENPILFTCTADDEKEQDVECGCSCQILLSCKNGSMGNGLIKE